jgi:hypothetical protein
MNLRDTLRALPPDAMLPAAWICEQLDAEPSAVELPALDPTVPASWRERLWTAPPDMRLGVREVAEALDRSADWVYRAVNAARASEKGRRPLPCARLDGELLFRAGDVRTWVQQSEEVVNVAPPQLRRAS